MPRPDPSPVPTARPAPRSPVHLPLLLAALAFLAALIVTYMVAGNAQRTAAAELAGNFNFRARDMAASIDRRMDVYEEVLLATSGFLRGSVEIDRGAFAEYYDLLRLNEHFPGIEALGIAAIVPPGRVDAHVAAMRAEGFRDYAIKPPGPRPVITSITRIEPFSGRNLRAFGYDMFSEPVRRAAMEQARDTGHAAATGKVVLVQEGGNGGQPGFLMYMPVYEAGLVHDSLDARRAAIVGWVYAPFRMNDLMRGLGGEHADDLLVEIYDGLAPTADALLYRSSRGAPGRKPLLSYQTTVDSAGRTWTVVIHSMPRFEASLERRTTVAIALTGVGLGMLLALVVWLLASERRRALQLAQGMTVELRASRDRIDAERERVRLILQTAYDAFIAIAPDGRITDWNLQACKLFGWREDEAVGHDVLDLLVPTSERAAWRDCLAQFAQRGTCAMLTGPTETTALTRDGHAIPVEVAMTPLPTKHGYGVTAFVRDIRPRKETAERERQRQQGLEEARAALLRSQKLEAVGKLTGGVAHDFNNILHIISANVQLMLRSDDNGRKRLLNILDAVERGKKLAAQLLAFARRQPLHPSVVNLAQLIERMDALLHRAAGDSVAIRLTIPPDLWNVLVDPNQLENVLLNLVINARDAMEGGGNVTITLANATIDPADQLAYPGIRPGEFVTIAVSDTGSGMPPDVIERAFEPFFTTKPEGKGTGLGLSMAHGFVKQSGGHIRLASREGEGTTVTIYLPRALQDTPDPAFVPVPH
ncbi:diguanylate cyclase [Massilia sp. Root133]|uniref:CHASE domain-containing protein n=1 Tax=unclassified Massilia TaxID=2609279 RepID=UPI0006F1D4CA|nr:MULTISPECIES: CHASE domain-containing protein [unclassified Massilia]KQY05676.1 diguanylate cyclase [Massilia sp. Root133]KQZ52133.1 diguanylate cyclase [Massilia sp. Root1485]